MLFYWTVQDEVSTANMGRAVCLYHTRELWLKYQAAMCVDAVILLQMVCRKSAGDSWESYHVVGLTSFRPSTAFGIRQWSSLRSPLRMIN